MKRGMFALIIFFLCAQTGFLQELNRVVFDNNASQLILIEEINRQGLNQEPFINWFAKGHEEYEPDQEVVNELLTIDPSEIKIILVLGTWCGDSKREVPHFFKILDEIAFPEEYLKMIAVNRLKEAENFSMEELGITHVPTFIIINNGFESGRIVEFPEESLEKDFLIIISK
jgi:thiol-disulfide isomerase/thioredoxin